MANTTFSEDVTAYRNGLTATVGAGYQGLLSKLKIGDNLYAIKDPAVEVLAAAVETRLAAVETKTAGVTALTKDESSPKFATKVEQGANGQISVEYSTIRSEALSDTAVDGQFITTVSQDVNGVVSITRAGVTAGQVAFTSATGLTSTNVAGALDELYAQDLSIIGATTDGSTAITIYGSRAYAKSLVDTLAGTDWTEAAQTVSDIIKELEGSTATDAWITMADKVKDLTYTDGATSTTYATVKEYVEARISAVNDAAVGGITAAVQSLDATVGSTVIDTGKHVAVQVVETDGVLTSLTVTEDDIAGASALAALDAQAVKSVNGATGNSITLTGADIDLSGTTATKLDAAITSLGTGKANANAFSQDWADRWATSYSSGEETLSWTSTGVTVFVPNSNSL